MDWQKVELDDGRAIYKVRTESYMISVYDYLYGHVDWTVYDSTGDNLIARGKSASVAEAKAAAELAASRS